MVDDYLKQWLQKAMNDIKVMHNERNMAEENLVPEAICFHAQQAVEKFLKAFLVNHKIEFGKTHNLEMLLNQCRNQDQDFSGLSVGKLSEYAVEIRYPDEVFIPSIAEVDQSIEIAEKIKQFIFKKLDISDKEL